MAAFTFSQLTPTAFLERSARVFPDRTAVIDGKRRFTYQEFADRSRRLAGALGPRGIFPGDRVAALCQNSSAMLELHNGVPWAGAVLVPLNVRLSAEELEYILRHCGARLLVADDQLAATAAEVASAVGIPLVVAGGDADEYEQMLADAEPLARRCEDERALLALNYTSGTTGRPKGVMYHHRGAYLQSLAMAMHSGLGPSSRYLWTLPMFHCDGWCFPWAVSAAGAAHVCLPKIDPQEIWRLLRTEGITHFSAAPTVLTMIASAAEAEQGALERPGHVQAGGAPPDADAAGADVRPEHGGHPPLRADRDVRTVGDQSVASRVGRPAAGAAGGAQGPPGDRQRHRRCAPSRHGGRHRRRRRRGEHRRDRRPRERRDAGLLPRRRRHGRRDAGRDR